MTYVLYFYMIFYTFQCHRIYGMNELRLKFQLYDRILWLTCYMHKTNYLLYFLNSSSYVLNTSTELSTPLFEMPTLHFNIV